MVMSSRSELRTLKGLLVAITGVLAYSVIGAVTRYLRSARRGSMHQHAPEVPGDNGDEHPERGDDNDREFELYRMEYQEAARRYDAIYQAIWRIFSHLALVAGAILTFGGGRMPHDVMVLVASVPLLFWFFSTYLPLNRYGNITSRRLVELEHLFNDQYGVDMRHYTNFVEARRSLIGRLRRAHVVVSCVFWIMTIGFILQLLILYKSLRASVPLN
jgi:hypothetical protein